MIQLQRLEGFYWVARTEGYARAARAFPYPITQPGVHQQVRRLETDLGVRLFERVEKDRVRLTGEGRALYDYVAPFLEGLKAIEGSITQGSFGGTLRVHSASLHLKQLVPAWMRRLHARRPDITVELHELRTADFALLRQGEADVFVDWLPRVPPDIEVTEVGEMHVFIVVPGHHALATRSPIKVSDLNQEAFIAYNEGLGGRGPQLSALDAAGVKPARVFSADTVDAILGFVAAGMGVSLIPWHTEQGPRMAGLVAHPLKGPGARFPIHAAFRKSKAPHRLVQAAMECAP